MPSGRKPSKTYFLIKEYLIRHPHACGEYWVAAYNSDPDFGAYGKINLTQLCNARQKFRDELKLPSLHKRTEETEIGKPRGRPAMMPDSFLYDVCLRKELSNPEIIARLWNERKRKKVTSQYVERRASKLGLDLKRGFSSATNYMPPSSSLESGHKPQQVPVEPEPSSQLPAWPESVVPSAPPPMEEIPAGRVITVEQLTDAIMLPFKDLERQAARDMAKHVMNFFGYSDRIIDNVLEPEDRDAFYMLEDAGLLDTEREETFLYDGREWRIHYWIMLTGRILNDSDAYNKGPVEEKDEAAAVYTKVPEEVWQSRNPDAVEAEVGATLSTRCLLPSLFH